MLLIRLHEAFMSSMRLGELSLSIGIFVASCRLPWSSIPPANLELAM
jgi:hypothetical protein